MIKEKTELNHIGKIIYFMWLLFGWVICFPLYFLASIISSFGPIIALGAIVTYIEAEHIAALYIAVVFGVLGAIHWIYFIKTGNGIWDFFDWWPDKQLLAKSFGHTVKYTVPDEPTDTNSYKNSVSQQQLNDALHSINASGISWKKLAISTPQEREQIFAKYFQSSDKAKSANKMFEAKELSPARKATLNKMIQDAGFQDDSIKNDLLSEVKSVDGVMTHEKFHEISTEIKHFIEHKLRVDNHIKYEGRLSNNDIKQIKDALGYVCMGCGLDPEKQYGKNMKNILEAHHKIPWSEMNMGETRVVSPNDFFILCPTCHKMIHRLNSPDDLNGLKDILNKNTSWWF